MLCKVCFHLWQLLDAALKQRLLAQSPIIRYLKSHLYKTKKCKLFYSNSKRISGYLGMREDRKRHEESWGAKGMFTILIVLMVSCMYPMSKLINCVTTMYSLLYVSHTWIQVFFSKDKILSRLENNQNGKNIPHFHLTCWVTHSLSH